VLCPSAKKTIRAVVDTKNLLLDSAALLLAEKKIAVLRYFLCCWLTDLPPEYMFPVASQRLMNEEKLDQL
jgi:hypothetical protein